ncbi:tripartite tricarboxylate transporter substrate binding protein [Ottowia thiooxydans]|uniref:tripartite tricarboxylate transporter substrate binding protein n=1 Tax=Ottowia thiooxydans TaxID=219182 RepID=UPI00040D6881|nr:tripartite tricarboxylate transporter substrate binding protein [Ottowia thiooxydans]
MRTFFSFFVWLALAAVPAVAQTYPVKPIKLVVPFAAGGPTDATARALAEDLTKALGVAVVVENRAGANGLIATQAVAAAAPDGYTLIYTSLNHNVNPLLMKNPRYDPVKDFVPISQVVSSPLMLIVSTGLPYRSLADLIAAAKAGKSTISFGSAGTGGSAHLAAELLKKQAGVNMLHVPYKGSAPAVQDVIGSQITFIFNPFGGLADLLAGKRVRGLATTTAVRDPRYPDVPTMKELGFVGFEEAHPWSGLLAPAGTPQSVIDAVFKAVRTSVTSGAVRDRGAQVGQEIVGSTPDEFTAFLKRDKERWTKIIADGGFSEQ